MKISILIVGKKSFIGSYLFNSLKKFFFVKIVKFDDIKNKEEKYFKIFNYIINCTSNNEYINKLYDSKNDHDLLIAKKIQKLQTVQIFLSSRKVYPLKNNIKETQKTNPKCWYSKNKVKTENKLKELLKKKVLILRISNLIGIDNFKNKKRKLHKTFYDIFCENTKKGISVKNDKIYKDFLSIYKLCEIVEKLIKQRAFGIYNVSLGEKVYLDKLVKWLNESNGHLNKLKEMPNNYDKHCFYLNNDKLMKKINIKNRLIDLEKDCKKISKLIFKIK
jgi:nucleoside-diphosphate-sugar epimerase